MSAPADGGSAERNSKTRHPNDIVASRCGSFFIPMSSKSKQRRKSRGGAPLRVDPKGRERATARLVFALTPTQLAALQAKAKRRGLPLSALVRELVTR